MAIRALVWGENIHEHENAAVGEIYPDGMHSAIAAALGEDADIEAETATLQEPEHGLPEARLDATDVLLWWGHKAHGEVADAIVERVAQRVWEGMGLIVLHSGHFSKIFKRLMGTPVQPEMARGGRARAALGDQPHAPDRRGPRRVHRGADDGDVWRAFHRAGAGRRRSSSPGTRAARCSAPA